MKVFIGLLLVVFVIGFAIFTNQDKISKKMVEYPEIRSVVYEDGRSYCEKISQMKFSEKWNQTCSESGKENGCSLPEDVASSIQNFQNITLNHCLAYSAK